MPRQFGKRDISLTWSCDKCRARHEPGSACPVTRVFKDPAAAPGSPDVLWWVHPMPAGHWPIDPGLARDESFSWWVRSHCGHEGGARQWAFYDRRYALLYERVFRADPCRYTRCHDQKREGDA